MSVVDVDTIAARADAATPGPWGFHHAPDGKMNPIWDVDITRGALAYVGAKRTDKAADAAFIAHARTDVPALVAEVRALRAAVVDLYWTVAAAVEDTPLDCRALIDAVRSESALTAALHAVLHATADTQEVTA